MNHVSGKKKRSPSRTQMESRNKLEKQKRQQDVSSKKGANPRQSAASVAAAAAARLRGAQDKRGKPGLAAQQTASSKSVFSKSGKKRDTKMVAKQVAAERGNYRFVKSFN